MKTTHKEQKEYRGSTNLLKTTGRNQKVRMRAPETISYVKLQARICLKPRVVFTKSGCEPRRPLHT